MAAKQDFWIKAEQGKAVKQFVDRGESPFDSAVHEEMRMHVEKELRHVAEPFRTTLILRDLEEMSYEEIAEITQVSLGTVKSRLTRGREALKQRLAEYIRQAGPRLGLRIPPARESGERPSISAGELEVTS